MKYKDSIDGTSALAVDAFTYRLICKNGATAKIPHVTFNAITYIITHKSKANPIVKSRITHRLQSIRRDV